MSLPTSRDSFGLCPELNGLFAVRAQVAQFGRTRTSKAEPGYRHRDRDIDTDLAYVDTVLEVARMSTILSEDGHAIAVGVAVDELHRLFQGVDAHNAQHRTEDFFFVNAHVGFHVIENGWAHKVAAFITRHLHATPIQQEAGAFLHTGFNQGFHTLTSTWRNQWPQVGLTVCTDIDLHGGRTLDQLIDPLAAFTHHHGHRDRHATLTGRAKGSTQQLVDRHVTIRIRHHDAVIFGTHHGLRALARFGGTAVNFGTNGCRTNKGHSLDLRVSHQRIGNIGTPMNHVQHAWRQTRFQSQLGQHQAERKSVV